MRSLLTEFIGTFFLVLTIGLVVVAGSGGTFGVFAIVAALMVCIYAGGHISGAHYNPAVTLAATIRGVFAPKQIAGYVAAQVAAAAAAVGALHLLVPAAKFAAVTALDYSNVPAVFAAEFLFTFLLAWVVLNVATTKANAGNSHYGLAIAGVVLAGALAVGDVSGALFNPAVLVGLLLLGKVSVATAWIPFVAELAGAVLAAVVFKFTVSEKA